jgi:hypothetical protein
MNTSEHTPGFYTKFTDFQMFILREFNFECAKCSKTVMDRIAVIPRLKRQGMNPNSSDSYICLCEACAEYEDMNRVEGKMADEMYEAGFLSDEIKNTLK